jgi:hypothetical protein
MASTAKRERAAMAAVAVHPRGRFQRLERLVGAAGEEGLLDPHLAVRHRQPDDVIGVAGGALGDLARERPHLGREHGHGGDDLFELAQHPRVVAGRRDLDDEPVGHSPGRA